MPLVNRLSSNKLPLAAVAALLGAAACAGPMATSDRMAALPPPPPGVDGARLPAGQCIRASEIRNHTIAGPQTMLIDVNGRATYRVEVDGGCLNGAISSDPIITRQPPGSSIICRPLDLDLGVVKGGAESRCIVRGLYKLTPAEVAALPRKLKP